jgi:phage terminase large subunit-like protein
VDLAMDWQARVLSGEVLVGKMVRAAVERQVRDLERAGRGELAFRFDPEFGAKQARFCELLPHVDGPLRGEDFRAQGWQAWVIIVLFGWRDAHGNPRFRRAVLFMPKGNGKTFLAAALALLVLCTGGLGEKVFSAATAKEQARLSFQTARQMLALRPRIRDHFGLQVGRHAITQPATGGLFRPISSEARSIEGVIPSYILEDEIHAHATRELHDNLRSAAAKRPDSRMVVISTAGFDTADDAIGHEVYRYARQILEGEVQDDSQFAFLMEADRPDDDALAIQAAWKPETWRQANLNLGVSVDPVEVANEANEARQSPQKRASFFVKRLGWWSGEARAYFELEAWDRCADAPSPEQLAGVPCRLGLDLASKRAFACAARLFERTLPHRDPARAEAGETERHFYAYVTSFLHEEAANSEDLYRSWAQDRTIVVTPGNVTDYGFIRRCIEQWLAESPQVRELLSDPYESAHLAQEMGDLSVQFIEWPQRVPNLSPALKELGAAVLAGRFHHDGNRALRWMAGNVVAKEDANENVFPRKRGERFYIDGISAILNALGRSLVAVPESTSYLEEEELLVL